MLLLQFLEVVEWVVLGEEEICFTKNVQSMILG